MDFSEISAAFRNLGIAQEVAECHGLLCGLWCASGGVDWATWIRFLRNETVTLEALSRSRADPPTGASPVSGDEAVLQRLYEETVAQLEGRAFELQLLLPDDEQPLALRTEALADWCKGFLFGLGAGGIKEHDQTSGNVQEIVRDFTEITRAYHDEEEDSELDEVSFMEVVEYVRVGTMLIYEELQAERQQRQLSDDRVLH